MVRLGTGPSRAVNQVWYQAETTPSGSYVHVLIDFRNRYSTPSTNYARISLYRSVIGTQFVEFAYIDTEAISNLGTWSVNGVTVTNPEAVAPATFPAGGTSYVLSSEDGSTWTWTNPGYVTVVE